MDNAESSAPSAALSTLSRARLDELLSELLQRVGGVMDTQDRLRGLLDAVVTIAADLSLDRVLLQIVEAASRLADAKYAALGVLGSGPERRLREFVTFGLTVEQRAAIGDLPRGHGLLGHIIDHPEPLRLSDLHEHGSSFGFPPNHPPMRSFLGVPVRIRDKVFGNLYLTEKRGGGQFTVEDEEIVNALAAAAGVVIENARLYEEGARREAWLSAAAEITAALLGPVRREEALELVAERARAVSSADLAVVLLQASDDRLVIQVVSGSPGDEAAVGAMVAKEGTLSGAAVEKGSMLLIEDASTEPEASYGGFVPPASWPQPGPVMLLPLRTPDGVVGLLNLLWSKENAQAFHDIDVQLPAAFAEQAALSFQVARAQEDQALLAVFEDRDRIGRDLHDLVIQRLFAIGLSLENTVRLVTRPEAAARINAAVDDLDATIKDIRGSIFALSIAEEATGIKNKLLRALLDAVPTLGFEPHLRTTGAIDSRIPLAARSHLLAVVTEAVSNAARHAQPSSLAVELSVEGDELALVITDDGRGFDVRECDRDSGLRNMRERAHALAGSCEVESVPGSGTTITWRVPLPPLSDSS